MTSLDEDTLQAEYREHLGSMLSKKADFLRAGYMLGYSYEDMEVITRYGLSLTSYLDITLMSKYTPAEFRHTFPELYI